MSSQKHTIPNVEKYEVIYTISGKVSISIFVFTILSNICNFILTGLNSFDLNTKNPCKNFMCTKKWLLAVLNLILHSIVQQWRHV